MNTFTDGLHLFQHETGVTNWGEELNRTLGEVDRALTSVGARPLHWDQRVRGFSVTINGRSVAISGIEFETDGAYVTHPGGDVTVPVNPGPGDRLDLVVMDPESTSGLMLVQGAPVTTWQRHMARRLRVFDKTNSGLGSLVAEGAMSGAVTDVVWDPVNSRWLLGYVSDVGVLLELTSGNPPVFGLAALDPDSGAVTPLNLNWRLSPSLAAFGSFAGFLPLGLSVLPTQDGQGLRLFAFAFCTGGAGLMEFDETGEAKRAWAITNADGNLMASGPMHLVDLGQDTQAGGRRVRVVGLSLGVLPWHGLNLGNFTCEALLPNVPATATLGGEIFPLPVSGMTLQGSLKHFGPRGEKEPLSLTWDTRLNRLFTVEASVADGGFRQSLPERSVFAKSLDPPWRFLLSTALEATTGLKAYGLTPEPDQPLGGVTVSFTDAIALYDFPIFSAGESSPASAAFSGPGDLVVSWPAGGGGQNWFPWPVVGDNVAVLVEYQNDHPREKGYGVFSAQVQNAPSGQGGADGVVLSAGSLLRGQSPQGGQASLLRVYLGRVVPGGSAFTARYLRLSGPGVEELGGRLVRVRYQNPGGEGDFTWVSRLACPMNRPYQVAVRGYGGTGSQGGVSLNLLAFPGDLWLTYEGSQSSSNGRGVPFGTWPLGLELAAITQNGVTVGPFAGTFAFDAGTVFYYDDGFNQYQWQDPAAGPSQLPQLTNATLTSGSSIPDYRGLDTRFLFVIPPQPVWNFSHRVLTDPAKYSFELVGQLLPEESALPAPVFSSFGAPIGVGSGPEGRVVTSLSLSSLPAGAVAHWEPFEAPTAPAAPVGMIPVARVLVRGGHTTDIAVQDVLRGPDQDLPVVARETLVEGLLRGERSEADLFGGMGVVARLMREGRI